MDMATQVQLTIRSRSLLREQFHFCFVQSMFGRSLGDYSIETFCEIHFLRISFCMCLNYILLP